jgi:hypothetical protein
MELKELELELRPKRPSGYVVPDAIHEPLYVVCPVFNPLRWQSRWKHYERFAKHVADSGGVLYTVEVAFGERDHATEFGSRDEQEAKCNFREEMIRQHRWITLRTDQELWHKEAAINAGVRFLPSDWKYVAWIDGDVQFARPNWVGETIHQLQHYKFIQMFGHAQDLDPDYEVISGKPGFIKAYDNKSLFELMKVQKDYYYDARPGLGAWSGLAWACTREAWDAVGGLIDFPITGAADWYMAWGLIGLAEKYIPKGSHPRFVEAILDWQALAERHIRRNVGYMKGSILHYFHGRKKDRKYIDRSNLLAELAFDPSKDIKRDWQGLFTLCDDGSERIMKLRDGIMSWTRSRNEDTTEV